MQTNCKKVLSIFTKWHMKISYILCCTEWHAPDEMQSAVKNMAVKKYRCLRVKRKEMLKIGAIMKIPFVIYF
jgi:hypothetical protein